MKCPICNEENESDASVCQQCGFSLDLGQIKQPDFLAIEGFKSTDQPQWPEPAEIEFPAISPEPEPVPQESVPEIEVVEQEEVVAVESPPPAPSSDDDEMARFHIARGFEALRQELFDQAQWEFEQARNLADNQDIARLAQNQLDELLKTSSSIAPEPVRAIEEVSVPPTLDQFKGTNWTSAVKIGLAIGVLNIAFASFFGSTFCFNILSQFIFGSIAGSLVAGRVDDDGQPLGIVHAAMAGGLVGLIGWLGGTIWQPILATFTSMQMDPELPTLICFSWMLYLPTAITGSILGWRRKISKLKN